MPPLCTHIHFTAPIPEEVRVGFAGGPGWVRGSRCPRRESILPHCHLSGRWRAPRGWGRIHVEDNSSHAAGRREARDRGPRLGWLASSGRCPPLAPTACSPRPSPQPPVRLPPPRRCAPGACALPPDARGWSRRLRNAQTFPQFPFRRLTVQEIPIIPETPSALAARAPVKTRHSFPKPLRQAQGLRLPLFTLQPIPEMPSALGADAPVKTRHSFPKPFDKLRACGSETDSHNSRNTLRLGCEAPAKTRHSFPKPLRQAQGLRL
jgi:hypothetical protein